MQTMAGEGTLGGISTLFFGVDNLFDKLYSLLIIKSGYHQIQTKK